MVHMYVDLCIVNTIIYSLHNTCLNLNYKVFVDFCESLCDVIKMSPDFFMKTYTYVQENVISD